MRSSSDLCCDHGPYYFELSVYNVSRSDWYLDECKHLGHKCKQVRPA
jgi:hypothetical protein